MFSKKKITKFGLLVLISQGEFKYNGYVLKKLIAEEFGFDNENVFPILRLIVEQKLVDVNTQTDEMNRTKKFYALNELGWKKLEQYQASINYLQQIISKRGGQHG